MRALNDQHQLRRQIGYEIDRLISLLDAMDGDCDLEDGGDAEPEETDQDGDEGDCSTSEDELDPRSRADMQFCGHGVNLANDILGGHKEAERRAKEFREAPPKPIVYDLRGLRP